MRIPKNSCELEWTLINSRSHLARALAKAGGDLNEKQVKMFFSSENEVCFSSFKLRKQMDTIATITRTVVKSSVVKM